MRSGRQQHRRRDRRTKWARVKDTGRIGVLDLFAGCGGMSLGFTREGFTVVGAVELDELASLTHAINFHRHQPAAIRELHRKPRDITTTNPEALQAELGLEGATSPVDVIIGGPPCQSYARVGRAKLREVYEHPRAFKTDPRGNLGFGGHG